MTIISEPLSLDNYQEWDIFLRKQPFHSPFQSGEMWVVLKDNPYYTPYGKIFRDQNNRDIVGGYVFHVIQEIRGLGALLATRSIMNGGPIIKNNYSDTEILLNHILSDLKANSHLKGIYLEIWNNQDWSAYSCHYKSLGLEYSGHLNFIIDLSQEQEVIWKSINKRKRRYIMKNETCLIIRQIENLSEFDDLYALIKETYSRIKLPLIHYQVFKNLFDSGIGLFLIASKDGIPVASRVVLCFGCGLYDWYAGSSNKYNNLHVNESLVWWVLKYGSDNNYKTFDFGGAGKPNEYYGPRDFKAQFKGKLVDFGRYTYTLSPLRHSLLNIMLKIRKKIMTK